MKKIVTIFIFTFFVFTQLGFQGDVKINSPVDEIRKWILIEIEEIRQEISMSLLTGNTPAQHKQNYFKARIHYKHIEFLIEYFSPREAKYFINGPLVFKENHEASEAFPPQGFQRIGELLFSKPRVYDTIK